MRPSFAAFADEMKKIAAPEERSSSPGIDMAKIVGAGALGFGAGTAAGLGAGYVAEKAYKGLTGKKIPRGPLVLAAPLLGTGAGITYAIHKAREQEALRRVLEDSTDPRGG